MRILVTKLIIVSAFLPYILGCRVDFFFCTLVFFVLAFYQLFSNKKLNGKILALAVVLFFSSLPVIFNYIFNNDDIPVSTFFSSVSRFLLPFFLLFIFSSILVKCDDRFFVDISFFILKFLVVITSYTIFTVIFRVDDVFNLYAVGGYDGVWWQAYNLNRYTGIFNQPLESGIFYSTMLFVVILLNKQKFLTGWRFYFYLLFILIGGALSFSKNFIVLGLFIALLQYLILNPKKIVQLTCVLVPVLLFLSFIFINISNASYLESFVDLYNENGFLYAITAGRFGSGQTQLELMIHEFIANGFLYGVSINSTLPFDNAYIEYAYQGGIVPLIMYVSFFLLIFIFGLSLNKNAYGKTLLIIACYGIFCSIGGPVINANRACIFYLLFISMFILLSKNNSVLISKVRS
ncbi:hypothetical protein [Budvicia diplopodorum]|uniref:hypothetical protein n=1 Tax=Budvicia diplopodorum TaxID=1119056 RepID=UPI00135BE1F6|nr:hypothetical protein [Budvicia diplopodorum]